LGYAPLDVQKWWTETGCTTTTSSDPCQTASDRFGIAANVTWGFAPPYVQNWWLANGCGTTPSDGASVCQRAANAYRICNGVTWGFAPNFSDDTTIDVQSWWTANSCNVCAE
jgi:hypothetical protein